MASEDTGSKRSLTVLAVVVACFAVLWPKIFYPMVSSIIFPSDNTEEENLNSIKNLNFYKMLHPQMREAMGETRPSEKQTKDGQKVLIHPSLRHISRPQTKGAGAVNLVIPVYTIGITLFFIYTLLRMIFRKPVESNPFVCYQQKTVCVPKCAENEEPVNKRKEVVQERKTQRALEQYGKEKVLTALKTIILEMEDFQNNFEDSDAKP